MATVDAEKKLQKRVLHWLVDDLGYTYLGNLEDIDNTPVKEDLLKANLKKRGYSDDQIKTAISELLSKVNNQVDTLYQINRGVYSLLRYGRQGAKDEHGRRQTVHYINWDDIDSNDFYVAEEVSVLRFDKVTRKRPDVVLYINGIALGVFELKSSYVSAGKGIRQMLQNQKRENILNFFSTAQFLFAGNEAEGLFYGTTDTPEKYYLKWREDKKATDDLSAAVKLLQVKEVNRLRDGVISLCHKERFLSLIHDFVIYDAGIKKVTRHNQYFANIAARKRIQDKEGGIIWNTQGSGKSLIMVWLTKWIIENVADSRVVIITDRDELDDQIESLFIDVDEKVRRAKSCADLRSILDKNEDAIVCSLIHKYGHNAGNQSDIDQYRKELLKDLPKDFCAKGNIVAFIDECHRTNSGKLHEAVKVLMPNAVLIGFTGTPLLKTDKQTSLETFGTYIHTYKFDEGVEDGVVLDLRYEARDVDQDLSSQDKVDLWFENKTHGLTERAKLQLKQSWTSINKLYSSKQRLEKIASDIVFDMSLKPRLKEDRGTAMLVANSIYEACRYWEIFMSMGFTKCAVVTSYEPTTQSVRTATTDPNQASEDEYKKAIYDRMLDGKKLAEFEKEAKERFKHEPAQMKLLIVVDKLLTGFDAPSATYLYIDKSMRDHDLFQAICRVNRPDGEDKDYGYIVDYMDLFRNVQLAVADYTTEAFDGYDKEDVEGLIKNRYDEAKSELEGTLTSLEALIENVPMPQADTDYIEYFCGDDSESDEKTARRDTLYALTAALSRSFANCCDRLVADYNYTEEDVNHLRGEISGYNKIKEMIKLASCDYIDLKPYNLRDVETEMGIQAKLSRFPVSDKIWAEYHLSEEVNDRGIGVDMALVNSAIDIDSKSRERLTARMQALTNLDNPNSVQQMKSWLADNGLEMDSLGKKEVAAAIKTTPQELIDVLSLRQQLAKSSVKKYTAMKNAVCRDNRARGMFQFYGANRTGRFAGRLIQLQNLPQNHMEDLAEARDLVRSENYDALEILYEDIPDTLSQLIRTAFVPQKDRKFIVADFSAIEARVLAWLAGEQWRMQVFEEGKDIYCSSASQMFGVPVEKHGVNGHLRQKGKIAELALGYGGSVGALKAMGALEMGIAEEELQPLVSAWRNANPMITRLWWDIDRVVKTCVKERCAMETHSLKFHYQSGFLFLTLPSGRQLAYVKPRMGENRFGGEAVTYEGVGATKKWERLESYGPKFTENAVQAIARDILMYSMQTLSHCDIVAHVHDEIIIECDRRVSLDAVCEQMSRTPPWAKGLLLRADGYECDFYKKD